MPHTFTYHDLDHFAHVLLLCYRVYPYDLLFAGRRWRTSRCSARRPTCTCWGTTRAALRMQRGGRSVSVQLLAVLRTGYIRYPSLCTGSTVYVCLQCYLIFAHRIICFPNTYLNYNNTHSSSNHSSSESGSGCGTWQAGSEGHITQSSGDGAPVASQ